MLLSVLGVLFAIIAAALIIHAYAEEGDDDYFFTPYHSPDRYGWAGNADTGYYKVYYAETSTDVIESLCSSLPHPRGCHVIVPVDDQQYHLVAVPFKGAYEYYIGLPGCNIFTHEMIHSFGYKERMIADFWTCGVDSQYQELPVLGVTRR